MVSRKRRPLFGIPRVTPFLVLAFTLALTACGGGGVASDANSPTAASPSSSGFALNVQLEGSGTVTSTPSGIDCTESGGTCDATYSSDTSVALVAAPSAEYTFEGWDTASELNCGNGTNCTAVMNLARRIKAIFKRKQYGLTVSVGGAGIISSAPAGISCGSTCNASYPSGTSVALSAAPASGYVFTGWSGSGISCPGTGTCTVPMTAARSVAATFSPAAATTYLLQVALSGSGTVSSSPAGISCGADCSQSYASGASVTLTATPAAGYTFSGWNGGGCSGTGSCTVSMTAARTTTATFAASTQALTVSVTGSGTVASSPAGINCGADCSESYTSGTSVTLTATPAAGNTFSGWSGSGCAGTGTCTVSMSAARSVTATFAASPSYALNVSVAGSGSVNSSPAGISCGADCSQSYTSGTSVTLTAAPANGYIFGGWSGACAGTSASCTVSMTMARSATATFTATASASTYAVSWNAVVDPRVTEYKLYYSTTPLSGGGTPQTVNVGNTTSYTFSPAAAGISVGTTVYFGVTAIGGGLESLMSNTVSVAIQ